MPMEMPEESLITIRKRELPADFMMPQMELAASHYSIGYLISGDRRLITPYQQIDLHAGDMIVMPPMLYHRTFSLSDRPYINYLIKISARLADDFCREIDPTVWREVFEPQSISLDHRDTEKVQMILSDMMDLYEADVHYTVPLLKGLLFRLIVLMWEKKCRQSSVQFKNKLSEGIMEAMYYVERNYSRDIRMKDAADTAGFSEGHFSRLFAAQVGISFSEYLINVRLRHVKELLLNTDLSVSEIAYAAGFANADYLSACFRRHEGMTPTAFRKGSKVHGY